GHAIEELDLYGYSNFDVATRTDWMNSLDSMATWFVANDDASFAADLEPFGQRYFLRAAALQRASILTGEIAFAHEASWYLSQGFSKLRLDGVLPERDGFDLNYQSLALKYAGEFFRMTEDTLQKESIRYLFEVSLPWIAERIDEHGYANLSDSTRMQELSRDGSCKQFDSINAVRGYLSGFEVTGNETWLNLANAVFQCDTSALPA
ncbi:MAG: hypothetical protein AAGG44_13910, partial [Planctomycetota bacterium]